MDKLTIGRDMPVLAADGEVGRVKHVIVDAQTREVTDLVVGQDDQEWLIPMSAVASTDQGAIRVRGNRAQFQRAASFNRDDVQALADERAREESQGRAVREGAALWDADDDAVVVGGIGEQPARTRQTSGRTVQLRAGERTIELHEEQLVPRKELREVGEILIHTQVEEVTGRLHVEEYREEAGVERIPVGQEVQERRTPWEEDGAIVVPIYEEQLVAVKQLVLREYLRIRRVGVTRQRLFDDTLRRERLFVEDPTGTRLVHEAGPSRSTREGGRVTEAGSEPDQGNPIERLVRKVFE